MRCLLDTCVVLWYFAGSARIPAAVRDELTNPDNEVFVSDVSILEVVIKHTLGKLPLKQKPAHFWSELVRRHHLVELPIRAPDICVWGELPLIHRDPFDRLLLAQAVTNKLCLITPDSVVREYDVSTWWVVIGDR